MTSRWLLTPAGMSGTSVLDSKGSWNGIAYGGYDTSSGNMALDGTSGYVDLGAHTVSATTSFAFWARIDSALDAAYDMVFFDFPSSTSADRLYLSPSGGGASAADATSAYFYANDLYPFVSPDWMPTAGDWTHYTVTLNASALILYVNGAETFVLAISTAASTRSYLSMKLGNGGWYSTTGYLQMSIADFQLADGTFLSASDAADLYNLGRVGAGGGCPT
jgi:hypothetical protein